MHKQQQTVSELKKHQNNSIKYLNCSTLSLPRHKRIGMNSFDPTLRRFFVRFATIAIRILFHKEREEKTCLNGKGWLALQGSNEMVFSTCGLQSSQGCVSTPMIGICCFLEDLPWCGLKVSEAFPNRLIEALDLFSLFLGGLKGFCFHLVGPKLELQLIRTTRIRITIYSF